MSDLGDVCFRGVMWNWIKRVLRQAFDSYSVKQMKLNIFVISCCNN